MAENEFTITESPEVTALRVTEVSPRGHARQSSGSRITASCWQVARGYTERAMKETET